MFGKVSRTAPVQESPSADGYIYAQRWNSAFRTPDPRGFLSVEECEARWSGIQADPSLGWFTVVPKEPGVGTFRRAADGPFLPDDASAVPTWTMEVIPSGGIAAMGPAFELSFWDAFNREYASATLANFWDGRPFLQDLAIRSYTDPALFPRKERSRGNVPVLINHFSWKPEKRGQRLRTDLVREEKTREQFADVDVSDNWFQTPGFGEWGTLASAVRAKLPLDVSSRGMDELP